jgi:hypothetical protein
MSRKMVVTNQTALRGKYGATGLKAIERAIGRLARADHRRGIATTLTYLDGPGLRTSRVKDPKDPAEVKAALDSLFIRHHPEYLVILGSHDVVPYQDMRNKLFDGADPNGDPDRFAYGDLPYACETPYSQDVTRFRGPTRVIGRIPDLTGAREPGYLIRLLTKCAAQKPLQRPTSAFGLSARVWQTSTRTSLRNLLGAMPSVLTSPKAGPAHARQQLREKVHFVNCHGDQLDHTFSGEGPRRQYSTAMDSRRLVGVGAGTVAAFECCYGAELYDPKGLPAISVAYRYLARGAAGVIASTTISYGPAAENANADLICQFFVEQVLRGASLGRAMLEARLQYIRGLSVLDAFDEKTLAQFVLLGDPSIHPFVDAAATVPPSRPSERHAARLDRRARLTKAGETLANTTAYTVPVKGRVASALLRSPSLTSARKRYGPLRAFKVQEPSVSRSATGKARSRVPRAKLAIIGIRKLGGGTGAPWRCQALLAYSVNGEVVHRELFSK